MTVLGDTVDGALFVLEKVTTIGPVLEDLDYVAKTGWFGLEWKKVNSGYKFKVNLSDDYVFIKATTEERARELRIDLIKKLCNHTAD